jgi:hypothetical protein
MRSTAILFGIAVLAETGVAYGETKTSLNLLLATEFGRGIGAGVEVGERNALVLGIGTGFGIGHSTATGWFGKVDPGVGLGYRRYLGNWFLGPTGIINYRFLAGTPAIDEREGWGIAGLLDFGHRWIWKSDPNWNTKLGIGGGIDWRAADGSANPTFGLTVSIGFGP